MAAGGNRDWAELPCDLLGGVAERLSASDYVRFGSVCTSWAACKTFPRAPQMPYLLHTIEEGETILVSFPNRNRNRNLHRITTGGGGAVDLRGQRVVGSQYGWLALLDQRYDVSLFNPLTGEKIRLPSLTAIRLPSGPSVNSNEMIKKIVLSSRPTILTSGERGFTAVANFTRDNRIAIARPGEDKWIYMLDWPCVTDVIYRNGKFLGISDECRLLAFDVTGPSLEFTEIAQGWGEVVRIDKYLVDSAGDLLMVLRTYKTYGGLEGGVLEGATIAISVRKFSEEHGAWLPLKTLGDNSLFLGLCGSISLSIREIPELRPNCVYYTQSDIKTRKSVYLKRQKREAWVFNLKDKTFDHYDCARTGRHWRKPIWITPSTV